MIHIILIHFGIILLCYSLVVLWRLRQSTHLFMKRRVEWWAVVLLVSFFVMAYFVYSLFLIWDIEIVQSASLIVSILFFGALFVAVSTRAFFSVFRMQHKWSEEIQASKKEIHRHSKELEKMVKVQTKDLASQNKELAKAHDAMLNILEDVTEEKDKLNLLLHSIGEAVIVINKRGIIKDLNNTAAHIVSSKIENLIGKKIDTYFTFVNEKSERKDHAFIAKSFKSGELQDIPLNMMLRVKNAYIPIAGSAAPIHAEDGKIHDSIIVFRDISKEKEFERTQTEFVSLVSHQLRTPLTGMRWFLEILQDDPEKSLTQQQKGFLQSMNASNDRMISLVNNLLHMARIEGTKGKFRIEAKPTNIADIVNNVITDNVERINQNSIKVVNHIKKKLILNIDEEKMQQVFHNLISNAIKYAKSRVQIDFEMKNKEIIFAINDDGLGVPKEQRKYLFQKFFRAKNVKESKIEGTGLGLYIVKAIVEAHGGKVWFEPKKQGSIFYVSVKKKLLCSSDSPKKK